VRPPQTNKIKKRPSMGISRRTVVRAKRLERVMGALQGAPPDEQNAILRAAIELIEPDRLSSISGRPF
jgi:hypothetical protein